MSQILTWLSFITTLPWFFLMLSNLKSLWFLRLTPPNLFLSWPFIFIMLPLSLLFTAISPILLLFWSLKKVWMLLGKSLWVCYSLCPSPPISHMIMSNVTTSGVVILQISIVNRVNATFLNSFFCTVYISNWYYTMYLFVSFFIVCFSYYNINYMKMGTSICSLFYL